MPDIVENIRNIKDVDGAIIYCFVERKHGNYSKKESIQFDCKDVSHKMIKLVFYLFVFDTVRHL